MWLCSYNSSSMLDTFLPYSKKVHPLSIHDILHHRPRVFHRSFHRQWPSGPPAQLWDVWSDCLSIISGVCILSVWECMCVDVYECHVQVTQAVLLLWYHLHFTGPPLGGMPAAFSASRHLSLSEISRDLQKHKGWSGHEHNHNLYTNSITGKWTFSS